MPCQMPFTGSVCLFPAQGSELCQGQLMVRATEGQQKIAGAHLQGAVTAKAAKGTSQPFVPSRG